MTNAEIAAVFEQIADLLEFQGANPFRVRAYRNGARAIKVLTESIEDLAGDPDRRLTDIAGIGKDLAAKVVTLVQTNSLPMLEELLAEIPESVLAILRVPGLGPKRAALLYNELGVSNLDQLRDACQSQRVRQLKGFGAKTEASILDGLEIAAQAEERTYWAHADQIVQSLLEHLRTSSAIERMEPAGSYRRGKDTVGDLDVLVVARNAQEAMDSFGEYPGLAQVLMRGDTKMSIRLGSRMQVDLRVVPAESFGAALQYFTGSKDHNIVLRGRAKDLGLKVNEYGVFRGQKRIAGATEEEVYAALNLPWFPPELREARREFDWAERGELPCLVEPDDIRGDLHTHSTWTDGLATIEQMATEAKKRGLRYIAITDHSKRVAMAGGLTAAALRRQWAEIDKLNEGALGKGFKILKGIEVDILERGGLDLDDEVLAEADWVVASVHYGQSQPRDKITRRVVEALQNPHVSAIAHPTGRLLNRRNAYEIDLDTVLKAARDHGKMMELNAHPMRLDLDDVACAAAKNYGVPIVISTDAHHASGLDAMRYGVLQARRGGLTREDVANTRTWPQMKRLLGKG
ncbi:MAG: DNA polymerase III subunit beta [Planctomycetes bacterium RBG_16_64_12]|nr:MAG: DNA polymerase III subunit beta [Planctomycetes bacterium RBG_16_64_12]